MGFLPPGSGVSLEQGPDVSPGDQPHVVLFQQALERRVRHRIEVAFDIIVHVAYDDAEMGAATIDHDDYGAALRQCSAGAMPWRDPSEVRRGDLPSRGVSLGRSR